MVYEALESGSKDRRATARLRELQLANRGGERRVQLVLGTRSLSLELPGDSVHTLQWS